MIAHWCLKGGSEVRDPFGDLCQISLPMSDRFGDFGFLYEEAKTMGKDTLTLLGRRRGLYLNVHAKPEEVESIAGASKIFYTPEDYLREIAG